MVLLSRPALLKVALILSVSCTIINGIDMAFNVYSTEIKNTFNLTQTQVEILASLDGIGIGLGLLEVPLYEKFGCKITYITIWLMVILSSGILALTAFVSEQFTNQIWVVFIAQLLMANGNGMSFATLTRAIVAESPVSKTGKLVGLMYGMECMAKIFFGGLMDMFFLNNLGGFFLTFSIISAVFMGVTFRILLCLKNSSEEENNHYRSLKTDESDMEEKKLFADTKKGSKVSSNHPLKQNKVTPLKEMLTSSFFHLLFWTVLVYYAITFTIMNNITTIAISQKVHHPMNTVYVLALCVTSVRILFGVILDEVSSVYVGFMLLLCGDFTLTVAILVSLLNHGPITVYVSAVLVGVSLGSGFTVCVTMLMKRYGKEHYSFLNSVYYAIFTICLTLFQLLFGFVYDSKKSADSVSCFGVDCFYQTFIVILGFLLVISIIQTSQLIYTIIEKRRNQK